jgi:hypothetical protein
MGPIFGVFKVASYGLMVAIIGVAVLHPTSYFLHH